MLRGVVVLILLASILPGGHAAAPGPAAPGLAAEGITWFAPDTVAVGHPVHAAVAVLTGNGFETRTHQNLAIRITLDDALLLYTPSVHEHHGLHLLTVTPMHPGTLRLWAGEPSDAHEHLRLAGSDVPGGVTHEVAVTGTALVAANLTRLAPSATNDGATGEWAIESTAAGTPFSALVTLQDEEGRLLASVWTSGADGSLVQTAQSAAVRNAHVHVMPSATGNETVFAEAFLAPASAGGVLLSISAPEAAPPPDCMNGERRLVLDPDSLAPGIPTWQSWSDVRAHLLDTTRLKDPTPEPLIYEIMPIPLLTPSGSVYRLETADPFGYAAFRVTQPGLHVLAVRSADGTLLCQAPFNVIPGPGAAAGGPGTLEVTLSETGTGVEVMLQSRGADGMSIPHYEFDVRIVRLADEQPGHLAWRAKLHGHQGDVSFHAENLLPGTYEMRVYPSPQDNELAPLAAGEDGFVKRFTVSRESTTAPVHEETLEWVPGPGLILLVVIAGAIALLRRRAGGRA